MSLGLSTEVEEAISGLPAEAMVRRGLKDFAAGRESVEGCLVQIGATRLRNCGLPVEAKNVDIDADRKLYALLCKSHGYEAHSQYNSLIRELVSFERGLERRVSGIAKAVSGE
jgi:hypothetical protein